MATKRATKATSKGGKVQAGTRKPRVGWKVGLPLRADGTTGENPCLCGCGTKVKRHFAQGHDARVHGWLLAVAEGERTKASLPAVLQKALADGTIAHRPKAARVLPAQRKAA